MDIFELTIDKDKFKSTNDMWNKLMLNDPWSVGYVSSLIESQAWNTKEDWESFYYDSGEQRKMLLGANESILNDFQYQRTHKSQIYNLPYNVKTLNFNYGRTVNDLKLKGKFLYGFIKNNGYNLTIEDCFQCVRFRTICETWNGIILRENNTINNLEHYFPNLEFRKTDGFIDHKYAIDYEVFYNSKLICALQIKPPSYDSKTSYLNKAHIANRNKNTEYSNLNKVSVFYVFSKLNGDIQNLDVISKIKTTLN